MDDLIIANYACNFGQLYVHLHFSTPWTNTKGLMHKHVRKDIQRAHICVLYERKDMNTYHGCSISLSLMVYVVKGTTLAQSGSISSKVVLSCWMNNTILRGHETVAPRHRYKHRYFYANPIMVSRGALLPVVIFGYQPHGLWLRQGFSSDLAATPEI